LIEILGIVGSPRTCGNTEFLVREVLKAAETKGAKVNFIPISTYELMPCTGCRICLETGECVIQDDVERIFGKMAKADGIVLGSPVYFGGVTAQMKILIDRIGYLNKSRGRKAFRHKIGGALAVGRRHGLLFTYTQILAFLQDAKMIIPGCRWVLGLGVQKGDVGKDVESVELARELGCEIFKLAALTKPLREGKNET
jgi:multimeric flavodoxin WrbA